MVPPPEQRRRRGRPPASDSNDTRRALVDGARHLFSERGYAVVTNREIAATAGITPGALYHYFESKRDLYLAVHDDVLERLYGRFRTMDAGLSGFTDTLSAVLEAGIGMIEVDPSLSRFLSVVPSDMRRHPELAERLAEFDEQRRSFFLAMVDRGVAAGEVPAERREMVALFVQVLLAGMVEVFSQPGVDHRRAVAAIVAGVRGDLLEPGLPAVDAARGS